MIRGRKAEGGNKMPHRVNRSEKRDDAMDRYVSALVSSGNNTDTSPIAQNNVSYDHAVVASKRQITIDITPRASSPSPRQYHDDLAERDMQRRILAGLPVNSPESIPEPQMQQPPNEDELLHTVEGMVPSVLAHRGKTMNKIAADMISGLIESMDMDPGKKRWLISQAKTGIVDPDIFMRDLRLSLK